MTDKFHHELVVVKDEVLAMAYMAEGMLRDSVAALRTGDRALAASVKERKSALTGRNDTLEEELYHLIALYHPVARDMRMIACSLKVIGSSERIGRYGKDIASVVLETENENRLPDIVSALSIPHMADLVLSMINDALKGYDGEDISYITRHSERDDTVDLLRHTIFREGLSYMMEDPRTISRCTNLLMVARYLERCADHSCKIAEKVIYMVTGERIEIR